MLFRKVQYGKETTRFTAVAATKMLTGEVNIPKDREPVFFGGSLGIRVRENQSVIAQIKAGDLRYVSAAAYFQELPLLLSLGLKGGITASEVTPSQADYSWVFVPTMASADALDAITLEMGDDERAYEVEGVAATSLKISGRTGDNSLVSVEAGLIGKQLTSTTFTAALSLPTREPIIGNLAKVYLDPSWATVGSTLKSGILREYSAEIQFGVEQLHHGAAKTVDSQRQGYLGGMMQFTFERGAEAEAIFDAFNAQTFKVMRLRLEGGQIGTGVNHKIDIDMGGYFSAVDPWGQEDQGFGLYTATFQALYDGTGAKALQAEVVTNANAI